MSWQRKSDEAQSFWDSVYQDGVGFTSEPNRLLVEAVRGARPGRALDLATGQGRNGLYLAGLGWSVVGVDISTEGLRQASLAAAARGLDFTAVHADLATYDLGIDQWDLVAMIYTPGPLAWIERVKTSLRPGGLFVYEFFAPRPDAPGHIALTDLEQAFAGWEVLVHAVVEDTPDWAKSRAPLVRFVARRP